MENEFDYYFIGSTYPNGVPLLTVDDKIDAGNIGFLSRSITVSEDYVARIRFGDPIPPKPRLVDYLSLDGIRSVFSKKIYDALKAHDDIKGLQLVSAIIRGKKDELHEGFWIANIYQRMYSFDEEKTQKKRISSFDGSWEGIKKVVLDRNALSKIPLKDRLVYVSKEHPKFVVYHKSVADIIISVNPEGIRFTPVEEWYQGQQFD
jgi:hypothetical protein